MIIYFIFTTNIQLPTTPYLTSRKALQNFKLISPPAMDPPPWQKLRCVGVHPVPSPSSEKLRSCSFWDCKTSSIVSLGHEIYLKSFSLYFEGGTPKSKLIEKLYRPSIPLVLLCQCITFAVFVRFLNSQRMWSIWRLWDWPLLVVVKLQPFWVDLYMAGVCSQGMLGFS